MKKNVMYLLLGVLLIVITGCDSSKNINNKIQNKENVKIVESENSKIEYEKYDNGLVSLEIPKGWKVEVAPVDYIHYSFKVYNPNNKNYMLLFIGD